MCQQSTIPANAVQDLKYDYVCFFFWVLSDALIKKNSHLNIICLWMENRNNNGIPFGEWDILRRMRTETEINVEMAELLIPNRLPALVLSKMSSQEKQCIHWQPLWMPVKYLKMADDAGSRCGIIGVVMFPD